jgi:Cytochrome c554 and c-prime
LLFSTIPVRASGAAGPGVHEGVASCAGSTCHSRLAPNGRIVRQNEIVTWQDESSSLGAHSRAFRVLTQPRGEAIAARLGLGPAERAADCLGCHTDNADARGAKFQISDGVGCESCHGTSGAWLAPHYAVKATHASNVALGMIRLEKAEVRAKVCLACHFGSDKPGQFVTHKMMAAGHPRISFELDLFTELQRHHDEDADYAQRKEIAGGVKMWAVGQAMALGRQLALYTDGAHGREGAFPELYFFDCQSCHRAIYDDPARPLTASANPGRPIAPGSVPFNDENMIMLSAAARLAAPSIANRFDEESKAVHASIARDPEAVRPAALALAATTEELASVFSAKTFDRQETLSILFEIFSEPLADRYTDYAGAAQAVMGIDTLLSALASAKQVPVAAIQAIRPDISELYRIVRDPNGYRPAEFRAALARVAAAVRRLQ